MVKNTTIWCIIHNCSLYGCPSLLWINLLEGNQNALYGKGVYWSFYL